MLGTHAQEGLYPCIPLNSATPALILQAQMHFMGERADTTQGYMWPRAVMWLLLEFDATSQLTVLPGA